MQRRGLNPGSNCAKIRAGGAAQPGEQVLGKFLTTHQIAGLLGVSERTVANWIDRGHLDAFRTPGGHRRVAPPALRTFLRMRQMPIPSEIEETPRILIVEDDPVVAEALQNFVAEAEVEYEVTTMGDGVSALIHIGNWKPQVVLLDILIPGMDGLEVCRKIRSNEDLGDTQVVFVTGYTDIDREMVSRDTGACEVLFKPVSGDELRQAVARAIDLHAGGGGPSRRGVRASS